MVWKYEGLKCMCELFGDNLYVNRPNQPNESSTKGDQYEIKTAVNSWQVKRKELEWLRRLADG